MTNQNTNVSNFNPNPATDLDTWGKTMTTDDANEIMEHGSEVNKAMFMQMLFAWQKYSQGC